MKKVSYVTAAWVGGLTGIIVLALNYLAQLFLNIPFFPFDFWNWQARVVPRNLLSLAVAGIGGFIGSLFGAPEGALGPASQRVGSVVLVTLVLVLAGMAIAWLKRNNERSGRLLGTLVGLGLFVIVIAIELTVGVRGSPATTLVVFGLLSVGWGFAVGAIFDGTILPSVPADTDAERRRGLIKLAGAAVAAVAAAWGVGRLAVDDEGTEATAGGVRPDQPLSEITPVPTPELQAQATAAPTPEQAVEIPTGDDGRILPAPGTRQEVTPRGEFYTVDIAAAPPETDGAAWRLVIDGLFESTPQLSLSNLRAYPAYTQPITLSCISNPVGGTAISTAYWTGLRLSDLMEDLGLMDEAEFLFIESADGFYETVPMADVMNPRTLLVYGMNDRTLPAQHGFPLRIYIPDRYGMKQPKWIERITAVAEDEGGYWTDRGWSKEARPNTTSVVDTVAEDAAQSGRVPVGGIAWAGARGIERVELQVDEDEWQETVLRVPPLGSLTWVQWRYEWPIDGGQHTFRVRATDGEGEVQTSEESGALPDGATGYHERDASIDES